MVYDQLWLGSRDGTIHIRDWLWGTDVVTLSLLSLLLSSSFSYYPTPSSSLCLLSLFFTLLLSFTPSCLSRFLHPHPCVQDKLTYTHLTKTKMSNDKFFVNAIYHDKGTDKVRREKRERDMWKD